MLGDSLTITLGGAGGTAKVLPKINQDGFGSEYYLREATQDFRAKVSHSKSGTRDRHYVEFTQTVYAVSADDPDDVRRASAVILARPDAAVAEVTDLQEAMSFWMDATNVPKIIGWES